MRTWIDGFEWVVRVPEFFELKSIIRQFDRYGCLDMLWEESAKDPTLNPLIETNYESTFMAVGSRYLEKARAFLPLFEPINGDALDISRLPDNAQGNVYELGGIQINGRLTCRGEVYLLPGKLGSIEFVSTPLERDKRIQVVRLGTNYAPTLPLLMGISYPELKKFGF